MAAPDWKKDSPAAADTATTAWSNIRDNSALLFMQIALFGFPLEDGWTYAYTGTLGSVTTEQWSHSDGRIARFTYTYSSGFITKIVLAWDRGLGAGFETICACNITVDSNGNRTAATTSAS